MQLNSLPNLGMFGGSQRLVCFRFAAHEMGQGLGPDPMLNRRPDRRIAIFAGFIIDFGALDALAARLPLLDHRVRERAGGP